MLYIMRHGKTEWNARHKLQGRTDIPLNDEGRAMAEKACREYRDLNIDICYCSPLKRAVETALLVLKDRNVPIIPDERLVEMCFGEYEGMENVLTASDCPIQKIFTKPEEYLEAVGGAESFAQLFARTGSFLKETVEPELREGKDILIVGHGAMNSSIICQVKGLPIEKFWSAGLQQCRIIRL